MFKIMVGILFSVLLVMSAQVNAQKTATLTIASNDLTRGTTDPAPGDHEVTIGEAFSVKGIPESGYSFSKWTGGNGATVADENAADTTVTLTKNATLTAVFVSSSLTTAELTVAVTPENSGTTTPAAGTHTYNINEDITITATPATGYQFSKWTGGNGVTIADENATETTCQISKNASLTAVFENTPIPVELTISTSPTDSGTTDPVTGTYTYDSGEEISIKATASTGYQFLSWSASGGASVQKPTSSNTTVTLSEDGGVQANFVPSSYEALTISGLTVSLRSDTTGKDKIILKNGIIPSDFPTLTSSSSVTVSVGGYSESCTGFEGDDVKKKYVSKFEKTDGTKIQLKFDFNKMLWSYKAIKATAFDSVIFNTDEETKKTDLFLFLNINDLNYGTTLEMDEKTSWKWKGESPVVTSNVRTKMEMFVGNAKGKYKTNLYDNKDSFKFSKGLLYGLTPEKGIFKDAAVSVKVDNLEFDSVFNLEQANPDKEVYKGAAEAANGIVKLIIKQVDNNYVFTLKILKTSCINVKGPNINFKLTLGTYNSTYKYTSIQKTKLKYKNQ